MAGALAFSIPKKLKQFALLIAAVLTHAPAQAQDLSAIDNEIRNGRFEDAVRLAGKVVEICVVGIGRNSSECAQPLFNLAEA